MPEVNMKKIILIFLSGTLIHSVGFASVSAISLTPQRTTSAHIEHLNRYYGDLNLTLDAEYVGNELLVDWQLQKLESSLRGELPQLKDGELTILACNRCVCNGCK